ncbi:chromate efflux transporter [Mesobacillus zeae]|uniref:Chromate efflux transporter n=1 Tax=Mesobacillus zeae TaxID=1917180 RepID=A0A398B755_9BACI|nr:chromate efflux transporter [Mesobacillus zeae]RID85785.1 chromate efflux transporter [Mesobacillus zeae]
MKPRSYSGKLLEILSASLKLGLTSFGGPAAHIGYFREEYVHRRKWLNEKEYADLVALCQFLPGPASSQAGMGIGMVRGGLIGGLVSFIGFTLPSVVALTLFAMLIQGMGIGNEGWLHGLKLVAAAVVLHAVLGMGKSFASTKASGSMAAAAAVATLLWQSNLAQVSVIACAAVTGMLILKNEPDDADSPFHVPIGKRTGLFLLSLFAVLLILLPLIANNSTSAGIILYDSFFRSGALVFGGGHVVLPLLEREIVPGFLDHETFLAGYGAAQAVPGPLFTFASYLGMAIAGWKGMLVSTLAIFTPAFLLVGGTLPFWSILRKKESVKRALAGVNAAVVGILLAALYDPIITSSVHQNSDFSFAAILFVLLAFWKLPPWVVVILGAAGGQLFF